MAVGKLNRCIQVTWTKRKHLPVFISTFHLYISAQFSRVIFPRMWELFRTVHENYVAHPAYKGTFSNTSATQRTVLCNSSGTHRSVIHTAQLCLPRVAPRHPRHSHVRVILPTIHVCCLSVVVVVDVVTVSVHKGLSWDVLARPLVPRGGSHCKLLWIRLMLSCVRPFCSCCIYFPLDRPQFSCEDAVLVYTCSWMSADKSFLWPGFIARPQPSSHFQPWPLNTTQRVCRTSCSHRFDFYGKI